MLAFFSGGYADGPRDWAGAVAWALVAAAVALDRRALPRARPARLAAGALALFAVWTLVSVLWTPVAGRGYGYAQIAFVYLGAVLAGAALLRGRVLAAAVEPVLLLGSVAAIGYGLSARYLPGLIHIAPSPIAEGRLNDPLTYWNAHGRARRPRAHPRRCA